MASTVGFLGLGRMGEPMARNLLRAGFRVRAWNRTASRAGELGREGATIVLSPAEAARGADFCVTMVADPPHPAGVRQLLAAEGGRHAVSSVPNPAAKGHGLQASAA